MSHGSGVIPIITAPGFETFVIVIYVLSASVSLLMFIYGLLLIALQPSIWHNRITRVIIVAQILNCLRFVVRLIASIVPVTVDVGCRALLFINNALALLPVNLCIYCVVYLQIVIVHKVSPQKRWPSTVLMLVGVAVSIIPPMPYLYISPKHVGIESYCHFPKIMSRKLYAFSMLSTFTWGYFSGVVGVISVALIGRHILRTRKDSRRILALSMYSYHPSYSVVKQSRSQMLHRTLLTIIWYPITPILSLWLNAITFTIAYYKQRSYVGLEFVNIVMLGMQSVLLGIALVVNPSIREAFRKRIYGRLKSHRDKTYSSRQAWQNDNTGPVRELPPLSSTSSSLSNSLSDRLSDF